MSIVKIVLNINGVDTPVSIDEAKKLYNDLKVVFGNETYWNPQPRTDFYGQHSFHPDYGKISWSSSPSC